MKWTDFYLNYYDWSDGATIANISELEEIGPIQEVSTFLDSSEDKVVRSFLRRMQQLGERITPERILQISGSLPENTVIDLIREASSRGDTFTPEQMIELADYIDSDEIENMIHAYIASGKTFDFRQMIELADIVSESVTEDMIHSYLEQGGTFIPARILDFEGYVSEKVMTEMVLAWQGPFTRSEIEELDGLVDDEVLLDLDRKNGTHVLEEDEEEEDNWDDDLDDDLDEDDPDYDYADDSGEKPGFFSTLFGIGAANRIVNGGSGSSPQRFRIGQHVRVRYSGSEGTIVDILEGPPHQYMVSLHDGKKVEYYKEDQLEAAF